MPNEERLGENEIREHCSSVPDWTREDKYISRRYRFGTFLEAISFVNGVANIAEHHNHHPFISVDYKFVTLRLTSWHAGGLTSFDFVEAKEFDRLYDNSL